MKKIKERKILIKDIKSMTTDFYIPILDTDSGKFDTKEKMSADDYGNIAITAFKKNRNRIDDLMTGRYNQYNPYGIRNIEQVVNGDYSDDNFKVTKCEVIVNSGKFDEIGDDFFMALVNSGKMFLLRCNFNPDAIDYDGETELRRWSDSSLRFKNDRKLDEKTKFFVLPRHNFWITVGENKILLKNTKLLESNSTKKEPFKYCLFVEKAIIDNNNRKLNI